jgi:hypothetical protein
MRQRCVTASGWEDSFYPKGMRSAGFLPFDIQRGGRRLHYPCELLEWTSGDRLRHAQFVGLKEDQQRREVVKEHAGES